VRVDGAGDVCNEILSFAPLFVRQLEPAVDDRPL